MAMTASLDLASTAASSADSRSPDPSFSTDPSFRRERMRQLHEAHARPLYRYLLTLTFRDSQAAEDLLQETLLRAWQRIDDLNPDVTTLRPWLMTVARHIAIDKARARRCRPVETGMVDLATVPSTDDPCESVLSRQVIAAAMRQLTPEHREVIFQVYFRGQSCVDTAKLLGIPEGTVKSRAFLALRALRRAMTAEQGRRRATAG